MGLARSTSLLLLGAAMLAVSPARAQRLPDAEENGARPSQPVPRLDEVGVDEKLGEPMLTDLTFRDHTGRQVKLADYFDGERPVLLSFAYHSCQTLCAMVLEATTTGISGVEWTVGQEYEVVTISIDPADTPEKAARKRAELLRRYGRDSAEQGWHFLVGDQETITRATEAAGFRYFYDERLQNYAHPATIMFLTPDGRFARYLYGITFEPNDIRIALLEASRGNTISTVEQIILYCYRYDPNANSYVLLATNIMKIGGALTLFALALFLGAMWRRERSRSSGGEGASRSRASTAPQQVTP